MDKPQPLPNECKLSFACTDIKILGEHLCTYYFDPDNAGKCKYKTGHRECTSSIAHAQAMNEQFNAMGLNCETTGREM